MPGVQKETPVLNQADDEQHDNNRAMRGKGGHDRVSERHQERRGRDR